jgi:hypothetical protein
MNPNDLFDLGTTLGRFGVLGLLSLAVITISVGFVREWIAPGAALKRVETRAERNLAGWEAATSQFERSIDLIEKMQDRQRRSDEAR